LRAFQASDKPQRALKGLEAGQNQVTRQLLAHDPECLLPLLVLHLELQAHYVESGKARPELLLATRKRIRSLAQVYAAEARSEMAPALAAMSLVEMADELERSGYLVSALVVLREAIALDRENADVLLDLAYQYEYHGMRSEALDLLRRLLELDPRSEEGRLRLAMNLLHVERPDEAAEILEQLVATGSQPWILAVAHQELAGLLTRRDRLDDATALLRAAVARLPEVQRLYIQLAYLLDRSGQRRQGDELLARLPADGGRPSPRLRYRVRSEPVGGRSRAALLRHSTARLPQLAAALAGGGAAR
jgi:tetratricopeptide (TPR) repeat protein